MYGRLTKHVKKKYNIMLITAAAAVMTAAATVLLPAAVDAQEAEFWKPVPPPEREPPVQPPPPEREPPSRDPVETPAPPMLTPERQDEIISILMGIAHGEITGTPLAGVFSNVTSFAFSVGMPLALPDSDGDVVVNILLLSNTTDAQLGQIKSGLKEVWGGSVPYSVGIWHSYRGPTLDEFNSPDAVQQEGPKQSEWDAMTDAEREAAELAEAKREAVELFAMMTQAEREALIDPEYPEYYDYLARLFAMMTQAEREAMEEVTRQMSEPLEEHPTQAELDLMIQADAEFAMLDTMTQAEREKAEFDMMTEAERAEFVLDFERDTAQRLAIEAPYSKSFEENMMPIVETKTPNIVIPDNTGAQDTTSSIVVDRHIGAYTLTVDVDIAHTYVEDLKVDLIGPKGELYPIMLHDRDGEHEGGLQATYALDSLFTTSFGTWTLRVGDYAQNDSGVLRGWTLTITPLEAWALQMSDPASAGQVPMETEDHGNFLASSLTNVFSDDFENLDKWTESPSSSRWRAGYLDDSVYIDPGDTTNKVAEADGRCNACVMTIKDKLDLSSYSSATLEFHRYVDSDLDSDEYLKVEIRKSGGSWTQIYKWTHSDGDDSTWHKETYDLASYLASDFEIRFTAKMTLGNEDVGIDNVTVKASSKVTVFEDDFNKNIAKWDAAGSWYASHLSSFTKVAKAQGSCIACTLTIKNPIDLSSYSSATLMLDRYVSSHLDSNEYLKVEIRKSGGSWTQIYKWTNSDSANSWVQHNYDLADYLASDFEIKFTANMNLATENVGIDNVKITGKLRPSESTVFSDAFNANIAKWNKNYGWEAAQLNSTTKVATTDGWCSSCTLTIKNPIDLSSYSSATLKFKRYVSSNLDSGEYLKVEIKKSGGSWTQIYKWTHSDGDDSTWHKETYDLADYLDSQFQIRFTGKMSMGNEDVGIDNLVIKGGTGTNPAPVIQCDELEAETGPYQGGDRVRIRDAVNPIEHSCATITLGGITLSDGTKGFITSGHGVNFETGDRTAHDWDVNPVGPLGKVISTADTNALRSDTAFVEYTKSCTDSIYGVCWKYGYDAPIEANKIEGNSTYTVTGSYDGITGTSVRVAGTMTGETSHTLNDKLYNRVLDGDTYLEMRLLTTPNTKKGDSGAPVYTVPSSAGTVNMVGVYVGFIENDDILYGVMTDWSDAKTLHNFTSP